MNKYFLMTIKPAIILIAVLWSAISHLIVLLSDGYEMATIFDYRMAIRIFIIVAISRLITILGSKVAISRL